MSSYQNDLMLDAALIWVRDRVTKENVDNALPSTYAEATSTYMLAQANLGSSGATLADGDSNGRKLTMAARNSVSVSTTGTASHVALTGSTGSTLLLVTACTTQALTTGNTVNIPAWKIEMADVST
jgi:hypothetical protein